MLIAFFVDQLPIAPSLKIHREPLAGKLPA
jgi:hypothetical protein